jgi:transposase
MAPKEVVRSLYHHSSFADAEAWIDDIIEHFADRTCPPEVRRLGRTIRVWRDEILAWHKAHLSNRPTEAIKGLTKGIKRVAFGFHQFKHFRIRALLYAGKPNWGLLATIPPR